MMQARADSLYEQWDVMWRKSDSLRIESMLLRMESNQLKQSASKMRKQASAIEEQMRADTMAAEIEDIEESDDSLMAALEARRVSVMESARLAQSNKLKKGLTESDSGTAWTMAEEPEVGTASYYAEKFHGLKTSSGETYNMKDLTCAHRWLPYGTLVEVTNLDNGRKVRVRVNDRGPFKHGRVIDLSKAAATELDMIRRGTARVELRVVE